MLTQEQYNKLCNFTAKVRGGEIAQDIADLLESFEVLHAVVDRMCLTGAANVGVDAFDAMFDERGEKRVELVCHGRAHIPANTFQNGRTYRIEYVCRSER